MRLIDADDVKELLIGLDSLPFEEEVDELIDRLPTVEAKPSREWEECDWVRYDKHGKCIHPKEALRCSNCSNAFKKELLWKANFCPNCGADMRGEKNEESQR